MLRASFRVNFYLFVSDILCYAVRFRSTGSCSAGRLFPKREFVECPIKPNRMLFVCPYTLFPCYISHSTFLKQDSLIFICSITMPPRKGAVASRSSKSSTATPCILWVCFNAIPFTDCIITGVPEVVPVLLKLSNRLSSSMMKQERSKSPPFRVYILVYYLISCSHSNSASDYDDTKGDKGKPTCVPNPHYNYYFLTF